MNQKVGRKKLKERIAELERITSLEAILAKCNPFVLKAISTPGSTIDIEGDKVIIRVPHPTPPGGVAAINPEIVNPNPPGDMETPDP